MADRSDHPAPGRRRPPETGAPSATAEELQTAGPGARWAHEVAGQVQRTGGNVGAFRGAQKGPRQPGADAVGNRVGEPTAEESPPGRP